MLFQIVTYVFNQVRGVIQHKRFLVRGKKVWLLGIGPKDFVLKRFLLLDPWSQITTFTFSPSKVSFSVHSSRTPFIVVPDVGPLDTK